MKKRKKIKPENYDVLEMVNREGIEKLNKGLSVTVKLISIPLIIGAILVTILAFGSIFNYFDSILQSFDVNIMRQLEQSYHQKFKILSQDTDEFGNGTYVIYPKKEKNLTFTVYKQGGMMLEDYIAHSVKYYVEDCKDKDLLSSFQIIESKYENKNAKGVKFLSYYLVLDIDNYEDISEACLKMDSITRFVIERQPEISAFASIKIGDYESPCDYEANLPYNELVNVQKYEYIDYCKKNGLISNISQQEVEENWKQRTLIFEINGRAIPDTGVNRYNNIVTYNPAIREYEVWLPDLIKNFPSLEKGEYDTKVKYKNKWYTITVQDEGIEKNKIPYHCRMSYLQRLFGAEIGYGETEVIEAFTGKKKYEKTITISFPQ